MLGWAVTKTPHIKILFQQLPKLNIKLLCLLFEPKLKVYKIYDFKMLCTRNMCVFLGIVGVSKSPRVQNCQVSAATQGIYQGGNLLHILTPGLHVHSCFEKLGQIHQPPTFSAW